MACYAIMKAELVIRERLIFPDQSLVEMVVWREPTPVSPTKHGFKYRLVYIVNGRCVLGYDNERGKGDHRHFQGTETTYTFASVEQLVADFWSDVRTLRGDK
jgi:hypothetical protein